MLLNKTTRCGTVRINNIVFTFVSFFFLLQYPPFHVASPPRALSPTACRRVAPPGTRNRSVYNTAVYNNIIWIRICRIRGFFFILIRTCVRNKFVLRSFECPVYNSGLPAVRTRKQRWATFQKSSYECHRAIPVYNYYTFGNIEQARWREVRSRSRRIKWPRLCVPLNKLSPGSATLKREENYSPRRIIVRFK